MRKPLYLLVAVVSINVVEPCAQIQQCLSGKSVNESSSHEPSGKQEPEPDGSSSGLAPKQGPGQESQSPSPKPPSQPPKSRLPPIKINLDLFEGSVATFSWPKINGATHYVAKVTHAGKDFTKRDSLKEETFEFTVGSDGMYDVQITAFDAEGAIAEGRGHVDTKETPNKPVEPPPKDLPGSRGPISKSGVIMQKEFLSDFKNYYKGQGEFKIKVIYKDKKIATVFGQNQPSLHLFSLAWKEPGRYDVILYVFDKMKKLNGGGVTSVFVPSDTTPKIPIKVTPPSTVYVYAYSSAMGATPVKDTDMWTVEWTDDSSVHEYNVYMVYISPQSNSAVKITSEVAPPQQGKAGFLLYQLKGITCTFFLAAFDEGRKNLLGWAKEVVNIP